jgi:hypothetical protein
MRGKPISGKDAIEAMINAALNNVGSIRRADSNAPLDPREEFEMKQALLKTGMRFLTECAACGCECEMEEAMGCACGRFLCPACAPDYDGETCDHEPEH